MSVASLESLFRPEGKVAVVTGGGGVLGRAMVLALGGLGVRVAVLGRTFDKAEKVAAEVRAGGGSALAVACDVTDSAGLETAREKIEASLGPVDILLNGAGGNDRRATTGGVVFSDGASPSFFDIDPAAVRNLFDLNFLGTLLPSQAFGRGMATRGAGCIVHISSMAGIRPLTKVAAYGAAKAAVENLTRWMAVHFASAGVRVNAIAPGFFLTEQNRFLLTEEATGAPTPRGRTILEHTPMRRYGEAAELVGALLYLLGPSGRFVTGTTLAVDGGFSAFSGV